MKSQKAKTYLIAGGAGFIGSFLCERLVKEKQRVFCLDNFLTGSKKNIHHLFQEKSFTFLKLDITREKDLKKLNSLKLDYILHLASPAGPNPLSPKSYHQLWQETYLANSLGTHNLCNLASKTKAVFLFASSSEVYGNPEMEVQKENYLGHVNPIGPRAIYDEAKRLGEAITANFSRHLHLQTRIARIFNTYGPRMNIEDGRALPLFIYQILQKKPIFIYGNGKQTRSFCYIDDQVEALLKLLRCDQANALPVNLGNPQEITILQLVEKIKAITGYFPKINYLPLPEDDPEKRKPDIELAKKLLKWQPKISLEEGLNKTINYFKKSISRSKTRP